MAAQPDVDFIIEIRQTARPWQSALPGSVVHSVAAYWGGRDLPTALRVMEEKRQEHPTNPGELRRRIGEQETIIHQWPGKEHAL